MPVLPGRSLAASQTVGRRIEYENVLAKEENFTYGGETRDKTRGIGQNDSNNPGMMGKGNRGREQ